MQTITLRLKLYRPTQAKQRLYKELTERVTAFANNLVATGRPKNLTSKTAVQYLPAHIPSAIVNQALRMEKPEGIRNRRKRDRKDRGRSLHSWSFHRLQQFIAYKAQLAGIRVEWVVPANTSRTCPVCATIDKDSRKGIKFECRSCGHKAHADAIGALNISRGISGLAVA